MVVVVIAMLVQNVGIVIVMVIVIVQGGILVLYLQNQMQLISGNCFIILYFY